MNQTPFPNSNKTSSWEQKKRIKYSRQLLHRFLSFHFCIYSITFYSSCMIHLPNFNYYNMEKMNKKRRKRLRWGGHRMIKYLKYTHLYVKIFSIFINKFRLWNSYGKTSQSKGMKESSWRTYCIIFFPLIFKLYPYHLSPKHLERIQTKPATVIHPAFWFLSQKHVSVKEWSFLVVMYLY